MNLKYPLLLIMVFTAAYLVFFGESEKVLTEENQNTHHSHAHHAHEGEAEDVSKQRIVRNDQVLSTGVDMFNEDSPSENVQDDMPEQFKDTVVWQVSEEAEEALKESEFLANDLKNEAYIELDVWELDNLAVGDYMDLYIPQIGGSFTGEVDMVTNHPNGDRTVEAYIPGAGSLYSAVITYSENAVYGTLGTQDDVYFIEGDGRHAWIASKRDLIANHQELIPTAPTGEVQTGESDPFSTLGN